MGFLIYIICIIGIWVFTLFTLKLIQNIRRQERQRKDSKYFRVEISELNVIKLKNPLGNENAVIGFLLAQQLSRLGHKLSQSGVYDEQWKRENFAEITMEQDIRTQAYIFEGRLR